MPKFIIDDEIVMIEDGRCLRPPETAEMMAEIIRQRAELERIYKLPELEWLLVKSLILQHLATLARNGWSREWADKTLAVIDQGSRYVHKLIQERDALQARIKDANA